MEEKQFWAIIDASRRKADGDQDEMLAAIRNRLKKLTPAEVADFQRHFDQKMHDAYDWNLWGAAYLVNGGCSDDGFAYFRAWLISQGNKVYSAALRKPDSLTSGVDPDRDDYEFEDLWYVGREVYEELTGNDLPPEVGWPESPKGERWDFDDDAEMSRRFPKLFKRDE